MNTLLYKISLHLYVAHYIYSINIIAVFKYCHHIIYVTCIAQVFKMSAEGQIGGWKKIKCSFSHTIAQRLPKFCLCGLR